MSVVIRVKTKLIFSAECSFAILIYAGNELCAISMQLKFLLCVNIVDSRIKMELEGSKPTIYLSCHEMGIKGETQAWQLAMIA